MEDVALAPALEDALLEVGEGLRGVDGLVAGQAGESTSARIGRSDRRRCAALLVFASLLLAALALAPAAGGERATAAAKTYKVSMDWDEIESDGLPARGSARRPRKDIVETTATRSAKAR